jgi:hypothetical protein
MNARILGAIVVALVAATIIGAKATRQRPARASDTARAASPSVVLVADLREADSECGCGQVIRRVREAKARGVNVQEIGPTDPAAAPYGVTVAPTVLVLGADGRVVTRREGESSDVLAAISADLSRLEGQKR